MSEPTSQDVSLPHGVTLMADGRVLVSRELIWHPDVRAVLMRSGWNLEPGYSDAIYVLSRPGEADRG